MSWLYRRLVRPVLFAQDAEATHDRTLRWLAWVHKNRLACDALESFFSGPPLAVELFGLTFPNPVGLAAGMDKHAEALRTWAALGFGFSELGGVTWLPQSGNPPPRLFRAVPDDAIVNRMGFNNPGAEAVAQKLAHWKAQGWWPAHPVAINLGKSKITPLEKAAEDYANSFRGLKPYADFFVVNVSSPNTPGLRQLQDKTALDEILAALQSSQIVERVVANAPTSQQEVGRAVLSAPASSSIQHPASNPQHPVSSIQPPASKPLLIKVSPDLSFPALDEILEVIEQRKLAGIVATNTTTERPHSNHPDLQRIYSEAGGLSGRPLRTRSTEVISHLYRQTRGKLPIIGVGGIFNAADAWEKITAGASLVQLYTGLIYEGPGIAKSIVTGLLEKLEITGIANLRDAVGSAVK